MLVMLGYVAITYNLLRVMVTSDDALGTGNGEMSAATQKVGKARAVTLDSKAPVVGDVLTATLADGDGTVERQWQSWSAQNVPAFPVLLASALLR